MATYKVLQDIEAEDKIVGPLTLRQFIYGAISVLFLYLSFYGYTRGFAFLIIFFGPPALLCAFLAIPWRGDQPTEVWAIAKLRFLLKPRKRIWDQSGTKNLVTITVPRHTERHLTNGLTQTEVRSRLHALASTIDSRGWAVKNSHINLSGQSGLSDTSSDRLVDADMLPQEVSTVDVTASDDMLDETTSPIAQHFDSMMNSAAALQKQQIVQSLNAPDPALSASGQPVSDQITASDQPADNWYTTPYVDTPQAPVYTADASAAQPGAYPTDTLAYAASVPSPAEEALLKQSLAAQDSMGIATNHLKRIQTPEELRAEQAIIAQSQANATQIDDRNEPNQTNPTPGKAQVTSDDRAVIINLANNDDLSVATIARQVHKKRDDDQEVVIPLRSGRIARPT